MAHDVLFRVPNRSLGKADIEFTVKSDSEKLGTLRVSKGAVVWFRRDAQKGHKVTWKQLDHILAKARKAEFR